MFSQYFVKRKWFEKNNVIFKQLHQFKWFGIFWFKMKLMSEIFNLNVLLGNHIKNYTIYWSKNTRDCKFSTEAIVQPYSWKKSCYSSIWSIWRSNYNVRIFYEAVYHSRCRTWNKLWLYFLFIIKFMSVTWSKNVSRDLILNTGSGKKPPVFQKVVINKQTKIQKKFSYFIFELKELCHFYYGCFWRFLCRILLALLSESSITAARGTAECFGDR